MVALFLSPLLLRGVHGIVDIVRAKELIQASCIQLCLLTFAVSDVHLRAERLLRQTLLNHTALACRADHRALRWLRAYARRGAYSCGRAKSASGLNLGLRYFIMAMYKPPLRWKVATVLPLLSRTKASSFRQRTEISPLLVI